ncbi:MerR family transcriptional regulator [Gorillibacterium massiliense]|uniref:MerR family transcriptional regulator n=1 Tax=Gorillibacterium massiliense TaxID=1280390 RepID=UPI0004BB6464|nr:MerR family transcriptional regulator [Gorillibacterium massiliense]
MKVKEVAELTGISIRTLHHYDEIGLLKPSGTTEAGYRLYSDTDLEKLQQILFFRELEFPLRKIKSILESPGFNRLEALEMQRGMLQAKQEQLVRMIATLNKTIEHAKGDIAMTNEEKFKGFDFSSNPYEDEAKARWGEDAVNRANSRLGSMAAGEQKTLGDEMNALYSHLADLRHTSPASEEAQAGIKEWFLLLNQMGSYSLEAFRGLGQMYVADERFTKNIDKFGEGLAAFMRDAMAVYADSNKRD